MAGQTLGLRPYSATNSLLASLNVDNALPAATEDMQRGEPSSADQPRLDHLRITSAIRAGNEAAFQSFYENYCDRLYRYLLVLTRGNEDLSRELLQTTMAKVVRSIKPFADERSFWSWLSTIARNAFLDACRKAGRGPSLVPFPTGEPEAIAPTAPAQEELALEQALDESLHALDAEERELIEAFYFGQASQQSIAERRNTTAKAVESKLARIRQRLRENILKRLRHEYP
jgi:RNA polymerase sigma-70 factor (ECF subfamily)